MKKLIIVALCAVLWGSVGSALIASADHDIHQEHGFVCFKAKDEFQVSSSPLGVAPEFNLSFPTSLQGCTWKRVAAKEHCIPIVVSGLFRFDKPLPPPPCDEIPPDGCLFSALPDTTPYVKESLCYRVKCDKVDIPEQTVTDAVGTRKLKGHKAFKICLPANNAAVP